MTDEEIVKIKLECLHLMKDMGIRTKGEPILSDAQTIFDWLITNPYNPESLNETNRKKSATKASRKDTSDEKISVN